MKPSVTFATVTQAAIFEHELKGQISDGMWENTRNTSWELWCRAESKVGEDIGREGFYPRKDNFNFASSELIDIIGERMIAYARLAKAGIADEDLDAIESICTNGLVSKQFTMKRIADINNFSGKYWDGLREVAARVGYERIKEALDDESYGMKELKEDLKAIKKTVRIQK